MDPQGFRALVRAMRAGGVRRLRRLRLAGNRDVGDEGAAGVVEALGEGACPGLQKQHLASTGMGPRGCAAPRPSHEGWSSAAWRSLFLGANPDVDCRARRCAGGSAGRGRLPVLEELYLRPAKHRHGC